VRIDVFIEGIPYSQQKVRGDREAAARWTQSIIQTTKNLPKVKGPVSMSLKFVLPADKYPLDHPYGSDLDNLVKRLLDALNMTILANVPGMDGAVVRLLAKKRKASKSEQTGVRMILNEL
jgi:Holliday junction resolvase RusA-like endonuclease